MKVDVAVVGGGLIGTSAAFFLRRRGLSVALFERDLIGSKASGASFGNIRRQGRPFFQLPLANRSRAIWGQLPTLIGEDAEFMATGHLRVAHEEDQAAKSEAWAREAAQHGIATEMLSGNQLYDRFPFLGRRAIFGCFCREDGNANPRLAAPAFGRAAARIGAAIHENEAILDVVRHGADFVLETSIGRRVQAPILLVANGAWGGRLSAQFGEPVPIEAAGPQMAVTEPVPYSIAPVIGVTSDKIDEIVYFRQVSRGNIVLGGGRRGPADIDTARARIDPGLLVRRMPEFAKLLPALGQLRIIRSWSGVEGYVGDGHPIIGPSAKVPGLFYAFGFSGVGFQLAPGVGDVMAEMIDRGQTDIPLTEHHISRFAKADPD